MARYCCYTWQASSKRTTGQPVTLRDIDDEEMRQQRAVMTTPPEPDGVNEPITLTRLLDRLEQETSGDRLTLAEVLQIVGHRGYGPLLLIVSLLAVLPTGIIPGLPSTCGISIALIAAQLVCGRSFPWLPERLRRLSIKRQRFVGIAHRIKPVTRRLDRFVKPRLTILTHGLAVRGLALACIVLGLLMVPLELLPFAVIAPGSAVALIGLGLSGHDGVWVIAGIIPAAAGIWLVYTLVT